LYTLFETIKKEKKKEGFFFNDDFEFFLEGIFNKLYKNKIIDEKTFNFLQKWLSKINLKSYELGTGALGV